MLKEKKKGTFNQTSFGLRSTIFFLALRSETNKEVKEEQRYEKKSESECVRRRESVCV